MPFIEPYRYERHHSSNLLAQIVIIFMDESNSEQTWNDKSNHVNGDILGSHDALRNNHGHLLTIVCVLVEPITSIAKPKAYI